MILSFSALFFSSRRVWAASCRWAWVCFRKFSSTRARFLSAFCLPCTRRQRRQDKTHTHTALKTCSVPHVFMLEHKLQQLLCPQNPKNEILWMNFKNKIKIDMAKQSFDCPSYREPFRSPIVKGAETTVFYMGRHECLHRGGFLTRQ